MQTPRFKETQPDETLLVYCCFLRRGFLIPPVQTSTARNRHDIYTESTRAHSLHVPIVSCPQKTSSPELLLCGTDSRRDASSITENFKLFNSRVNSYLSFVSSCYAPLVVSLYASKTTSFSNSLLWVDLGPCINWTIVKRIERTLGRKRRNEEKLIKTN